MDVKRVKLGFAIAALFVVAVFAVGLSLSARTGSVARVVGGFGRLCGLHRTNVADAKFMNQIDTGMTRMMSAMVITPSGDVDSDFVSTMVPHHQGAIDMAESELLYGKNGQLRRIAQEIIVDQQQEIAAMRLALGEPLPPSMPAPDQIPGN